MVGPRLGLAEHLDVAEGGGPHRTAAARVVGLAAGARGRAVDGTSSLPLWLPDPRWRGFNARDGGRARSAGPVTRLEQTLADTLAWERGRPADRERRSGLTVEEERELLAALAASTG